MDEVDLSECRVPITGRFHKQKENGIALGLESTLRRKRAAVEVVGKVAGFFFFL